MRDEIARLIGHIEKMEREFRSAVELMAQEDAALRAENIELRTENAVLKRENSP